MLGKSLIVHHQNGVTIRAKIVMRLFFGAEISVFAIYPQGDGSMGEAPGWTYDSLFKVFFAM